MNVPAAFDGPAAGTLLAIWLAGPALLLALLAALRPRLGARGAVSLALLPVLPVLATPTLSLRAEVVLLGSFLQLDLLSRLSLALVAALLLAGALLLGRRPREGTPWLPWYLLSLAALLLLPVAADAPLFLSAVTVASYALLGAMVSGGACTPRQALLPAIMLVAADLALFELTMILAHASGSALLAVQRELLAQRPATDLASLAAIVGFTPRMLLPALALAPASWRPPALRPALPALVALALTGGLLGALRWWWPPG